MDAYRFLMRTYRKGDKICLFGKDTCIDCFQCLLDCILGFSRGAYTARALAGMLTKVSPLYSAVLYCSISLTVGKVGLLLPENFQSVSFAYKLYARTDDEGIRLAAGFKKTFCQDVKVEFVGVWYDSSYHRNVLELFTSTRDTVQSTGILHSRALPFTNSNTGIRTFRHAVSLDEVRSSSYYLDYLTRFTPASSQFPTKPLPPIFWGAFFDI